MRNKKNIFTSVSIFLLFALAFIFYLSDGNKLTPETPDISVVENKEPNKQETILSNDNDKDNSKPNTSISLKDIPDFTNKPYIEINNNSPFFSDSDYSTKSFETYSSLDNLGRCQVAFANIGQDIMPTEERKPIGMIKPSGWHTVKYESVDGKYLYNRCHLIGYQLTAENANDKNLITGTRYFNTIGMLPFENKVANYIKDTNNHVLYRVTPIYDGNNLVASGVLMEAKSVEDNGSGICFNVYVYNNQPGININYATGESSLNIPPSTSSNETTSKTKTYIVNTNTNKFHELSCSSVKKISEKNKQVHEGTREDLIKQGYEPCKLCNP